MQKDAHLVELEKCCQTHIFLQNFVLIQPRTSPPKICKILQKQMQNFTNFDQFCWLGAADLGCFALRLRGARDDAPRGRARALAGAPPWRRRQRASVSKISAKCCSFSAVSASIFARKYAFCNIFQNLPDYQADIFEIWQIFANVATFANFLLNFQKTC